MNELKTILDEKSTIETLNKILKSGGVIAFVTDTVWGIGCLPTSKEGVEKIYNIKGRDRSKPLILMSNNMKNLKQYVLDVPQNAELLISKFFPGALTLVLEKSELTPLYITAEKNTVGIRIPDNLFFQKLCSVIDGGVLATTSANLSNQPASKSYEEAKNAIGNSVDIIFEDYNQTCKGKESTVVLVNNKDITVLREGSIKI